MGDIMSIQENFFISKNIDTFIVLVIKYME